MKRLIIAAALALSASPAVAEPVELVCEGTLHGISEKPVPVDGIHILITEDRVVVSGSPYYSGSYIIDVSKSDAAQVNFDHGEYWGGFINRYSGSLVLQKSSDAEKEKIDHVINANCGKADPLF